MAAERPLIAILSTQRSDQERWVRVATAILKGKPLPPVELIEVGGRYFVIDGHHRISVARMLKQSHIDAIVTVWDVAA